MTTKHLLIGCAGGRAGPAGLKMAVPLYMMLDYTNHANVVKDSQIGYKEIQLLKVHYMTYSCGWKAKDNRNQSGGILVESSYLHQDTSSTIQMYLKPRYQKSNLMNQFYRMMHGLQKMSQMLDLTITSKRIGSNKH